MTTPSTDIQQKLPAGWKWVKLGEVCQVNPTRPSMDWESDTRTTFVPMPSVDDQTGTITQPEEKDYSAISKGYTYFEEDDVLFAKITPCMQNGKHAIASGLLNGFAFGSTEFHVLRPKEEIISGWIHKFLRQPSILEEAKRHFRGAVGQQRVPKGFLGELPIPLPTLEEQKRIAGILNEKMAAVEEAKTAAQQRLEAVKALPAAYLRDVFPSSEDELPDGWKWVKLGDVCEKITDGSHFSPKTAEDGFPYITVKDLTKGNIDFVGCKKISRQDYKNLVNGGCKPNIGDILFSKDGTVGKTALIEQENDFVVLSSLAIITPNLNKVKPQFLYEYLSSDSFVKEATDNKTGAAIRRIVLKTLKSMQIILPPVEDQKRIASELDDKIAGVKLAEESIQQELDTIEAMPAALLRKAFKGEL